MKMLPVVVLASLVLACTPRQEPLNIGGGTYLGYQPLFLAAQMQQCETCTDNAGFIGGKPIEFKALQSSSSVLRLFRVKELDGALLSLDEAISLHQQTAGDICIAEVLSESISADAIVARKGLDTSKPFVLGYEQSFVGAYMLSQAIDKLHWDRSQLSIRYVTPNQHMNALLNGDVDAIVTFEPYLSGLVTDSTEILFSSADIPGEIMNVMVLRNEIFTQHQELIEWVLDNYLTSGLKALSDMTPETLTYFEENFGLSQEILLLSLKGIHFYSPANGNELSQQELANKIRRIAENKGMESNANVLTRCNAV